MPNCITHSKGKHYFVKLLFQLYIYMCVYVYMYELHVLGKDINIFPTDLD